MSSRFLGSAGILGLALLLVWPVPGRRNPRAEHDLDDGEVLEQYPGLSRAFKGNTFSISVHDGGDLGRVNKKTRVVRQCIENTFELDGLSVKTEYRGAESWRTRVKQVVTIKNTTGRARTVDYIARMRVEAERVVWDGKEFELGRMPLVFRAYRKHVSILELARGRGLENREEFERFKNFIHTHAAGSRIAFKAGESGKGIYDWSDALHLDPVVLVYRAGEGAVVEFVVRNLEVPAGGRAVIDPVLGLDDQANYDLRYDGSTGILKLSHQNSVAVGDVNGDDQPDLVLGTASEYVYVVFGGAGIATGERPLDVAANYNIRYQAAPGDNLGMFGSIAIGDVNGDGLGDLVLGGDHASNAGRGTGSAWVIFSTLIDDVGTTTGNDKPFSDPGNFNIRFDGVLEYDFLTYLGSIEIGDLNGDGRGDLVIGASSADRGGTFAGSAWVIFSTLIDAVGSNTGNIMPFSDPSSYNIRYDGYAASQFLAQQDAIAIADINRDGFGDLILGAPGTDFNGASSGSAWVMFSTLIDDVGSTTGNIHSLDVGGNYNIRYDGGAASDRLASEGCVTTGDVNGDGDDDLVLGASTASYAGSRSGSAWVIFSTLIAGVTGTGNNLPLSVAANYNIRYDSGAADDEMTMFLPPAVGDVNGDGLGDLVLGAYGADNNGGRSGSAWVMFSTLIGGVTGTGNDLPLSVPTNYNIRYDGEDASGMAGAVAIGDVNGDGRGDLVLGAHWTANNGEGSGSAWVVFSTLVDDVGTTTGNNLPLTVSANYNLRFDGAGVSNNLTRYDGIVIGDLDGDGFGDLIVGERLDDSHGGDSGSTYVVFNTLIDDVGATTGNVRPLFNAGSSSIRYRGGVEIEGLTQDQAVAVGDVNGDNQPDLVVGTYKAHYNGSYSGSAFVIFGGPGIGTGNRPLDVSNNYNIRYDGGAANDRLTANGAIAVGDVNGDGLGDLVLGACDASYTQIHAGSAWVIFSTLIDDVGSSTGNNKPLSDPGNFSIRYDSENSIDYLAQKPVVSDVNGDDLGDLILDAHATSYGGPNSGSAYVMFSTLVDDVGTTTGHIKPLSDPANYNIRYDGGTDDRLVNHGAVVADDMNGDGLGDLALGGYAASYNGASSGSVWVMFSTLIDGVGATTGNIKSLVDPASYNIRYDGGAPSDQLSRDHIAAGDVNGDGFHDLVLGAAQARYGGTADGSAYVIFSTLIDDVGASSGNVKPLSDPGSYNIRYDGGVGTTFLSYKKGIVVGDVNGDGLDDLVLGAYGATLGGSFTGSAFVIFSTLIDDVAANTGNNKLMTDPGNFNIRFDGGERDGLTFGGAIAIGDLSGDGLNDLVLGSEKPSYNGECSGSAWLLYSMLIDDVGATTGNIKPLSDPANYIHRFDGSGPHAYLTSGSLAFGDLDGDGIDDLVVGGSMASHDGTFSGSAWVIFGSCVADADCPPCYQCIAGTCLYQAAGGDLKADCTNANVCDGLETCDGSGFCRAGTPLSCDDFLSCNGVETCDPVSGCQPGVDQPDGTDCGGPCQWCQSGACEFVASAQNRDPFGECGVCRVCDGSGGCRAADDGTDPKGDCGGGCYSCYGGACGIAPSSCSIDGSCYTDGDDNPSNGCQWCDSSADSTGWTDKPDGTDCGICCACRSGGPTYDDTQDSDCPTCHECDSIGSCARIPDTCLIGGSCFNTGDDNPANDCETCSPADPNGWTVKPDGSPCGEQDPEYPDCDHPDECLQGVCDPGLVPEGTECGSPPQHSECDAHDTCDGLGVCQDNPAPSGIACEGCHSCDGDGRCDLSQTAADFSPCHDPDPVNSCEGYCYTGTCAVEAYCNRPLKDCDVFLIYGDQAGETLECRMPEDVVELAVEVGPNSGEAGEFVPVRVYLENQWSGPLFGLQLVLELESSGLVYVKKSALLDGGISLSEESVDELSKEVIFALGGAEGFAVGRCVLDVLLMRTAGGDHSFAIKAWLPCASALVAVGCHAELNRHLDPDGLRSGSQRVSSKNVVVRGAKYEHDDERVRLLSSPVLGCACGAVEGRGLLVLGVVFLCAFRRKFVGDTNLQ